MDIGGWSLESLSNCAISCRHPVSLRGSVMWRRPSRRGSGVCEVLISSTARAARARRNLGARTGNSSCVILHVDPRARSLSSLSNCATSCRHPVSLRGSVMRRRPSRRSSCRREVLISSTPRAARASRRRSARAGNLTCIACLRLSRLFRPVVSLALRGCIGSRRLRR